MVRHTRWITALAAVGLSVTAVPLAAQAPPPRVAKNLIFAEVSFFVIMGNVSVNYERRINDWLSGRVGVGAGYAAVFFTEIGGAGATGMLVFTSPRTESKFEFGLGVSVVTIGFYDRNAHAIPAITIGYRHQRQQGGFTFRVGANWTYLYGLPFQVSFGHAF